MADSQAHAQAHGSHHGMPARGKDLAWLSLGALGVVYGDIGTSPLYAHQASASSRQAHAPVDGRRDRQRARRAVAVLLVADARRRRQVPRLHHARRQQGRGRHPRARGARAAARADAHARARSRPRCCSPLRRGAALRRRRDHAGDLGARRGRGPRRRAELEPSATSIVPITRRILVGLFFVQKRGTARIGSVFGRSMLAVVLRDRRSRACRGSCATRACSRRSARTTRSQFLAAHGARLPRARLGRPLHHRRRGALRRHGPLRPAPIRLAWYALVFPALLLNYFGQGALYLRRAATRAVEPVLRLVAGAALLIPMVVARDARRRSSRRRR